MPATSAPTTTPAKKAPAKKAAAPKTPAKKVTATKSAATARKRPATPEQAANAATTTVARAKQAGRGAFPAIDLSRLDLGKLRELDLPTIDLPGIDGDKLATALRDAAYITVGFGVLAIQQAQVRRREIVSSLSERFGTSRPQMDDLLKGAEARLRELDERLVAFEAKIDARVDTAIEQLEGKLPQQATALLGQAHEAAKAARKQVRGFIRSAA
jgi:hypothetical protein